MPPGPGCTCRRFSNRTVISSSVFRNAALTVAPEGQGKKVSGKALITAGGKGELSVTLTFEETGKLAKVDESVKLMRGIRPICQATKLLDPDPIVRGMAEQDILVMGRDAADYLAEQRKKATLDIQQAIDRIWRSILDVASGEVKHCRPRRGRPSKVSNSTPKALDVKAQGNALGNQIAPCISVPTGRHGRI